jgi:hypothetical protein
MYAMRDPKYIAPSGQTYAQTLQGTFLKPPRPQPAPRRGMVNVTGDLFPDLGDEPKDQEPADVMASIEQQAIEQLRYESRLIDKIQSTDGVAWGALKAFFNERLPEYLVDGRDDIAYHLVRKAMVQLYGPQRQGWETFSNPTTGKTYVRASS